MALSNYIPSSRVMQPGVCTSSTRPASPYEGMVIYETDTDKILAWNGSAWYPNWNLPWGAVATPVKMTSTQSGITTETAITGASITWTAPANRLYKFSWHEPRSDSNGNVACRLDGRIRLTNISGTVLQETRLSFGGASTLNDHYFHLEGTYAPSSGSITLICTAQSSNSTSFVRSSTQPGFFTVEDIGPA